MSETSSPSAGGGPGPLAPLIHGRVRLLILSQLLAAGKALPFVELRARWALTDGTLSVHLSKLEEGGLVRIEKRFVGKRPQTLVALTAQGRRNFRTYIDQLRDIVPGLA